MINICIFYQLVDIFIQIPLKRLPVSPNIPLSIPRPIYDSCDSNKDQHVRAMMRFDFKRYMFQDY